MDVLRATTHPNLPILRPFQVVQFTPLHLCTSAPLHLCTSAQVGILNCLLDPGDKSHVFAGLPTGFGKSLPQLLLPLLSPPGESRWSIYSLLTRGPHRQAQPVSSCRPSPPSYPSSARTPGAWGSPTSTPHRSGGFKRVYGWSVSSSN
jgi:hypothetical protein